MGISISPTQTSLFGLGYLGVSSRVAWGLEPLPAASRPEYSHTHTGVSSSILKSRPRGLNPTGFSDLPGAKPVKICLSEGRFPPGRTENAAGSRPLRTGFRHLVSRPPLLHMYLWAQRESLQAQGETAHIEAPFISRLLPF